MVLTVPHAAVSIHVERSIVVADSPSTPTVHIGRLPDTKLKVPYYHDLALEAELCGRSSFSEGDKLSGWRDAAASQRGCSRRDYQR
jgi:hypothetical protein